MYSEEVFGNESPAFRKKLKQENRRGEDSNNNGDRNSHYSKHDRQTAKRASVEVTSVTQKFSNQNFLIFFSPKNFDNS